MKSMQPANRVWIAAALLCGVTTAMPASVAAAAKPAKGKIAHKAPRAPAAPPAATPEQFDAAKLVYLGHYHCEQGKSVDIAPDGKQPGYIDVKQGKASYLMKPVLSSTGAVRLEDVKGQTLMVQIAEKSMLLDVKGGHRLVDDCVSPRQEELVAEAAKAKAAELAASAAAAAASAASEAAGDAARAASQAAVAASAAATAASR